MGELVIAGSNANFESAVTEAAKLDEAHIAMAAQTAGFGHWLNLVDKYTLGRIGEETSEALRMPFPSPVTDTLRTEWGFSEGVVTEPDNNRWSLSMAEAALDNDSYDIGVRLVCRKKIPGKKGKEIRFPLDLEIPDYALYNAPQRPDRVSVRVGERQLPIAQFFYHEEAQRLLLVAAKFIEIVGSGQAAELRPEAQS